jgi:hypothetical protein
MTSGLKRDWKKIKKLSQRQIVPSFGQGAGYGKIVPPQTGTVPIAPSSARPHFRLHRFPVLFHPFANRSREFHNGLRLLEGDPQVVTQPRSASLS